MDIKCRQFDKTTFRYVGLFDARAFISPAKNENASIIYMNIYDICRVDRADIVRHRQ